MKTVTFQHVLRQAAALSGLDPDNLGVWEFDRLRDFADRRLGIAWDTGYWPELLRVKSASVTSDSAGIEQADVPSDEGTILGVYQKHPHATTKAREVSWRIYDDGSARKIYLRQTTTPVYVEYRVARPQLVGKAYDSSQSYGVGAQVYLSPDLYECVSAAGAAESPASVPAKWAAVKLPFIFGPYLSQGMYADWLRTRGEENEARAADADAEALLTIKADELLRQQGQTRRINFRG